MVDANVGPILAKYWLNLEAISFGHVYVSLPETIFSEHDHLA